MRGPDPRIHLFSHDDGLPETALDLIQRPGRLDGLGRYKYPSREGEAENAENDKLSLRIEVNHHGAPRASAIPFPGPTIARADRREM